MTNDQVRSISSPMRSYKKEDIPGDILALQLTNWGIDRAVTLKITFVSPSIIKTLSTEGIVSNEGEIVFKIKRPTKGEEWLAPHTIYSCTAVAFYTGVLSSVDEGVTRTFNFRYTA